MQNLYNESHQQSFLLVSFWEGQAAKSDTVADSKDCGIDAALPVLREGQGGTDVSLKIRWEAIRPSDNVFLFVFWSSDNFCIAF